jgi:hypothetical protein
MNTLIINNIEYDMSSPSGLEFKNKYITSFGDKIPPLVNVIWHHVNGFYLELKTDCEDSFVVEIIDDIACVIGCPFCDLTAFGEIAEVIGCP